MTPIDDIQSSEELLNSEEICIAPSTSSNVQIRVLNVSELNDSNNEAEAEAIPVPTKKRNLPSWMSTSNSLGNKKKKNDTADVAPEEFQEPEISSPSTSKADDTNESLNQNNEIQSDKKNKNIENGQNNVSAENSDALQSNLNPSPSTSNDVKIKTEPKDDDANEVVGHIAPTPTKDIKPAIKVEKEEATSSTSRTSCRFGIRCYRRNPMHRQEEAHPGDSDYRRPDYPTPPDNTPPCPYGDLCYRRNPVHFQQFTHPPSTDFKKNLKAHRMQLRERKQLTKPEPDSDDDGSDVFYDSSEEFDIANEIDEDSDEEEEEEEY